MGLLTLTQAGYTLAEAAGKLKYFCKIMRRKGYLFEYFAVPEMNPAGDTIHWHLLIHTRDWKTGKQRRRVPHEVLSAAAEQAGMGYVVDVQYINWAQQADLATIKHICGYTLKGATGSLWESNPGRRRVRYSRGFFPKSRKDLDAEIRQERDDAGVWRVIRTKPSKNDEPTP